MSQEAFKTYIEIFGKFNVDKAVDLDVFFTGKCIASKNKKGTSFACNGLDDYPKSGFIRRTS